MIRPLPYSVPAPEAGRNQMPGTWSSTPMFPPGMAASDGGYDASPGGTILIYPSAAGDDAENSHESASLRFNAAMLATLTGFDLVDGSLSTVQGAARYFLPSNTLDPEEAHQLGIRSEHDFYGGIVPAPFIATKSISHPLVAKDAFAPSGWSEAFSRRTGQAVLAGYSAFSVRDAKRAAVRLLEKTGSVRLKPAWQRGGWGQCVVESTRNIDVALSSLPTDEIERLGIVLEENLDDLTATFSVGQVVVAGRTVSYWGRQRTTSDNSGNTAYGGSDLFLVRGGFQELLNSILDDDVRLAVSQACVYDMAAFDCYTGLIASRRNYDVAVGRTASGAVRSGVLEQSWRVGGASGAELAALRALDDDPGLLAVRASTVETYGDTEPPSDAVVAFRGVDRAAGPMTKYVRVSCDGNSSG